MKDVLDKVLLTLLASVLSTYLLYSYNLYSKAFENAQVEARPYSTLAKKLYTHAIDDLDRAKAEVKLDQLSGQGLSEKTKGELLRLAKSIESQVNVLKSASSKTRSKTQATLLLK
jgi:hypothetical protein